MDFFYALLQPMAIYEAPTMASLLTDLASIVTAIMGDIATVRTTIVSTPLLLLTTGFLFIGGVVGIFGRLLSRG